MISEKKTRRDPLQVFLAENAGMCYGVKRALDMARKAAEEEKNKNIYVSGQLVHNRQVSAYLSALGITEIEDREVDRLVDNNSIFIFPSHGKGPLIYDIVREKNSTILDAVCPFVQQSLQRAIEARDKGYYLLIYGDKGHTEVTGYSEWLGEDCLVVREYTTELENRVLPEKLAVMAQTTADPDAFKGLTDWLIDKGYRPQVIDSLCKVTRERRDVAGKLAAHVDVMLVIGGKNSANTDNLTEYCKRITERTYWIETVNDMDVKWLEGAGSVGITAGASTPEWIIKEVVDMMEEFKDVDQEMEQEVFQELEAVVQMDCQPESALQDEALQETALQEETEAEVLHQDASEQESVQEDEAEPEVAAAEEAEPETVAELQDETEAKDALEEEAEAETALQEESEPEAEEEIESDEDAESRFSEAEITFLEFHPGDLIKGTVVKISSDEVLVDIGYKSEGIIPVFELAFTKVDPFSVVSVGDEIQVEIVKTDRDGNFILSRKNALFEEKINLLEELFKTGEPIEAMVIDVVKGGLLVDVGMRGFVPASHVERGFVKDLNEYLNKTLNFKVLELNRSSRKVILSRKVLLEEEYQKMKESFWSSVEEGQTRKGVVKRLTDFGAFVDIGGCDGLLHVSEMGWGKVGKPSDVVSINDEIEVYVLKVDKDKEKVSLSLKKLIPNPWDLASDKYQVGSIYTGKVMRGASFGAFIQLEPSLEGLAHISQLARFRVNKVEDVLVEGMEVPVKILEIDLERRRISLSVKEAIDLPKLIKDEPADAMEGSAEAMIAADEAAVEAFIEAAEESGSGTVGEALGIAMAEKVAVAVAEA
ncbi:MAG: bifunctional 4-hydroxy-3-methylbut-2-enyl diphosphate reductase/30S ribosomal protein S1, partial [Clostridiales bacterium]|nr:bifunctional 4-hydroxy-3-methylbut-2-enyl diphosphate reductase/30S ribosomal protein S1 [Clostridiales bacterium]